MKTFVINLQRAVERKKHMQKQLNRFSFLDVEFIDAIDGKQLVQMKQNLFLIMIHFINYMEEALCLPRLDVLLVI